MCTSIIANTKKVAMVIGNNVKALKNLEKK